MEMLDQVHKVGKRTGASPIWKQDEEVVVVQPGEEKAVQRPHSAFQCLKRPYREVGEKLCIRNCSDRTWRNAIKILLHAPLTN